MKNVKVVPFNAAVMEAKTCDVTRDDIMSERDLYLAYLAWNNPAMEVESEIKLIKHERAMDQFARKAA